MTVRLHFTKRRSLRDQWFGGLVAVRPLGDSAAQHKSNRITRRTTASETSPAPLVQRVQAKMAEVTAGQIKYLNDLGVRDVTGLDRITAGHKIQQLKAQSNRKLRAVTDGIGVVVDPADPMARCWRQMVVWHDLQIQNGRTPSQAIASALAYFDPHGKFAHNYLRPVRDAIKSTGALVPTD